ncbi:leucine zipper domain-containing protein, partial [Pseudomonas oryzihabitans]
MNLHKHARLTPRGRALLVQRMLTGLRCASRMRHKRRESVRTAYRWLRRCREEGESGLLERSSRPHSCPHETSSDRVAHLIPLRRSRHTYRQIAQRRGVAVSTVARRLKQADFRRLAELEPAPGAVRYEYPKAGDLLHLDIKRGGRFCRPGHRVTGDRQQGCAGAGWEFVQMAI